VTRAPVVATRGPDVLLLDVGDGRGAVLREDEDGKVLYPPQNLQSLLLRGYWEAEQTGRSVEVGDAGRTVFPIAKAADHRGLFVGLYPPPDEARPLALPGGEGAADLHVTLCYVPLEEDVPPSTRLRLDELLRGVAAAAPPLEGTLQGFGRFLASDSSDGKDVLWLAPDVKGLLTIREMVAAAIRAVGLDPDASEHGWTPHMTLAYLAPGLTIEQVPELPSLPRPLSLTTLQISWGDGGPNEALVLGGTVEKFNPYHAAGSGQFTTRGGGGGFAGVADLHTLPRSEKTLAGRGVTVTNADAAGVTAAAKAGGSGDVPVTSHAHANGYAVKAYLAGGTMTADGKGQLRIDVHDPSGAVVASATSTKAYDVWSAREAAVQVSHHALRVEAEAPAAKPAPAKPAAAAPAVTKPAAAGLRGGGAHDDPVRPTQLVRSVTEKGNEWVPASRKGFYTEVDHDVVPPGTTWATMWDQKRRVDLHVATAPKGWELRDDGAWHKGGDATQRAAVDPGGRHFNNVSAGGDGLPHVSGPVRRITNEAGKAQAQRAAEIKDVRERRRQANVADVARLRGDFEKSDVHTAWAKSLTTEERQAIGAYAYLEYGSMNAHLRGGGGVSSGGRLLPHVDRAIGRARVPFDVTTYRGARADGLIDPEKFDRNPAAFIGKTFTDKGFGSTSLNRQTGESSARRDEDTHKPGVLYEIRVPKGARGAFIDLKRDGILESAGDENELLLHRGTKYRVVSGGDREENGALHVVVEVVP
jgi:2'-5' RNA ligase